MDLEAIGCLPSTAAPIGSSSSSSSSSSVGRLLPYDDDDDDDVLQLSVLVVCLVLLNAVVVAGNSLVVCAVVTDDRLRCSATNSFVASLAVADLLLGLTVLPFSGVNQALRYWPFGEWWCSAWLAIDVWLCTSSILNLCAISLDRYLAIAQSFRYRRLMSAPRARALVACVWIAAFLICFPPLIGWKRAKQSLVLQQQKQQQHGNRTEDLSVFVSTAETFTAEAFAHRRPQTEHWQWRLSCFEQQDDEEEEEEEEANRLPSTSVTSPGQVLPQCQLNSASGYVIYSACGSFWIPMCVMVFFYWRIYVTASRNSRALRRGVVVVQSVDGKRGKGTGASRGLLAPRTHSVALRVHRGGGGGGRGGGRGGGGGGGDVFQSSKAKSTDWRRSVVLNQLRHRNWTPVQTSQSSDESGIQVTSTHHGVFRKKPPPPPPPSPPADESTCHDEQVTKRRTKHGLRCPSSALREEKKEEAEGEEEERRPQSTSSLLRLKKEKKAAKTIGVIVGCFIACWAPFFSVYLAGAFCHRCISERLFFFFFWLGYFNSAINPFVYGLCSRDFRSAFRRLLRCGGGFRRRPQRQTTLELLLLRS